MQVIEHQIEYTRPDTFYIRPIGDIHIGSLHCAENDVAEELSNTKKNNFIIGMGDYFDAILKNDKRFDMEGLAPWVEKGNILESQRKRLKALFEPYKSNILCMLTGNHEETIHLHHQDDVTRNLCDDLGVTYAGYSCYLILKFKRKNSGEVHQYIIHAWHGSGAAQTDGARLNRLTRLVNDIQADIYLMGHLHAMTQHTPDRLMYRNGKIKSIKLAATITGSWLKAYTMNQPASYAERQGYKPSRIGCPVIQICPDKDEFSIIS